MGNIMVLWVHGIMVLDVEWKFRDRGSIPSEYEITITIKII